MAPEDTPNPDVLNEKQTAEQRYQKHKEWRRKNKGKVRAQVARHDEKHPNQVKRREETRLRKEHPQGKTAKKMGPIKRQAKCSHAGCTKSAVEYDHHRGYGEHAPTRPLCRDHHNKAPQQNKDGEKSVLGGTKPTSEGLFHDLIDKVLNEVHELGPEPVDPDAEDDEKIRPDKKRVPSYPRIKVGKSPQLGPEKNPSKTFAKQQVKTTAGKAAGYITLQVVRHPQSPNVLLVSKGPLKQALDTIEKFLNRPVAYYRVQDESGTARVYEALNPRQRSGPAGPDYLFGLQLRPTQGGLSIVKALPGEAGARAGLAEGDIIWGAGSVDQMGEKPQVTVGDLEDLRNATSAVINDLAIALYVTRNGENLSFPVEFERDEFAPQRALFHDADTQLRDLETGKTITMSPDSLSGAEALGDPKEQPAAWEVRKAELLKKIHSLQSDENNPNQQWAPYLLAYRPTEQDVTWSDYRRRIARIEPPKGIFNRYNALTRDESGDGWIYVNKPTENIKQIDAFVPKVIQPTADIFGREYQANIPSEFLNQAGRLKAKLPGQGGVISTHGKTKLVPTGEDAEAARLEAESAGLDWDTISPEDRQNRTMKAMGQRMSRRTYIPSAELKQMFSGAVESPTSDKAIDFNIKQLSPGRRQELEQQALGELLIDIAKTSGGIDDRTWSSMSDNERAEHLKHAQSHYRQNADEYAPELRKKVREQVKHSRLIDLGARKMGVLERCQHCNGTKLEPGAPGEEPMRCTVCKGTGKLPMGSHARYKPREAERYYKLDKAARELMSQMLKSSCAKCNNAGQVDCPECEGPHADDELPRCENCGGSGMVTCPSCKGQSGNKMDTARQQWMKTLKGIEGEAALSSEASIGLLRKTFDAIMDYETSLPTVLDKNNQLYARVHEVKPAPQILKSLPHLKRFLTGDTSWGYPVSQIIRGHKIGTQIPVSELYDQFVGWEGRFKAGNASMKDRPNIFVALRRYPTPRDYVRAQLDRIVKTDHEIQSQIDLKAQMIQSREDLAEVLRMNRRKVDHLMRDPNKPVEPNQYVGVGYVLDISRPTGGERFTPIEKDAIKVWKASKMPGAPTEIQQTAETRNLKGAHLVAWLWENTPTTVRTKFHHVAMAMRLYAQELGAFDEDHDIKELAKFWNDAEPEVRDYWVTQAEAGAQLRTGYKEPATTPWVYKLKYVNLGTGEEGEMVFRDEEDLVTRVFPIEKGQPAEGEVKTEGISPDWFRYRNVRPEDLADLL